MPMGNDNFFDILKDPLSKRILLQIRQHESMSIDSLMLNLKINDQQLIKNRLKKLSDIDKAIEPDSKSLMQTPGEQYVLTERGHEIVLQLLTTEICPPISADKSPRWFKLYWFGLFVITVVLVGVVIPFVTHATVEKAVIYLLISLLIVGFGFYIRLKPLSLKTNRILYIALFGIFFGCWFSIISIIILSRIGFHDIDASVLAVWVGCFALGGLIGDLIGRLRHYKGPERYSF
jgi:hypothetical protein